MFSQLSPKLTMGTAALTLTVLLLVAGNSALHEQIAGPPFGEPSFRGGFSLPIIHRNSLESPLRDPSVITFDMYKEEIQLASSHVRADALASEKMIVPTHFRRGLYLVPLRIGGSLDRISSRYLMFDTCSDLSWTQCDSCYLCSRGHFPPYYPSKSSTSRSVSCDDPLCEHARHASCDESAGSGQCKFARKYVDGSVAEGYLVSDIFHFSLEGSVDYHFEPEVVFGCATAEKSQFVREYNTGILSLDTSSLSFLAQVRVDKFSYCVPAPARRDGDDQALSYLRFGSQARFSGKRIPFWNHKNKYHVYLKRVTYHHGNRLSQQQPVPIFPADGAVRSPFYMLVDSGTLGIWLPESIFHPLQKKISNDISLSRVFFDDNPNAYCYYGTMKDVEEVSVTLGFVGGAEMELFGDSLFFEFNNSEWICLGFLPSNVTILGIYAQRNTNMGFDLFKKEISIDQAGCGS